MGRSIDFPTKMEGESDSVAVESVVWFECGNYPADSVSVTQISKEFCGYKVSELKFHNHYTNVF